MSSITLTPATAQSWVRLDADFSDVLADVLVAQRTRLDTGAVMFMRAAGPSSAISGTYLGLNLNPDFETNATNWTALGSATIARSTTQHHRGVASLSITTTATVGPGAESEKEPTTPGQLYGYSAWVYCPSAALGMSVGINWYDATGAFLSSSLPPTGTSVILAVGWNLLQDSAGVRAPSGAAQATIVCQNVLGATIGAGNVFYLDEARLLTPVASSATTGVLLAGGVGTAYDTEMPLDTLVSYTVTGYIINGTRAIQVGQVTGTPVIVPSGGVGWLKDPLVPANSIPLQLGDPTRAALPQNPTSRVGYLGMSTESQKGNVTPFAVNNSAYPVALWRTRQAPTNTLIFSTRSLQDKANMRALLATGNPILLQLPAIYGEADRYFLFADSSMDKLGQDERRPNRVFTLPAAQILPPSGAAQGVLGARYQDMCNTYTTWGSFSAGAAGTYDSFSRTVGAGSWGSPDVGPAYTLQGTTANFTVSGGSGVITLNTLVTPQIAQQGNMTNGDIFVTIVLPVVATGSYYEVGVTARQTAINTYYRFVFKADLINAGSAQIIKTVTGTDTVLGTFSFIYLAGSTVRLHANLNGSALSLSAWSAKTAAEPTTPSVSVSDAAIPGPGTFGCWARANPGNTNTAPAILYDDFSYNLGATWNQVMDGVIV